MSEWWAAASEALRLDILGRLLLAVLLGGAVGLERETRGKAAGLRTNILICVGATLFTILSIHMAGPNGDPARIAAQIVTGVGFLGAGTILHDRGAITGLTSAATIWLVAAIGVALGAGAVFEATGATLLVVLVLGSLGWAERAVGRQTTTMHLTIWANQVPGRLAGIESVLRDASLQVLEIQSGERGTRLNVGALVRGSRDAIDQARSLILQIGSDLSVRVDD